MTATQRVSFNHQTHRVDWLSHTVAGQKVLADWHAKDARPLCQCVPGGVEMYVARRGSRHYLARMPGTGPQHAAGCPSMEENPRLYSGIGGYAPEAISLSSDGCLLVSFDPAAARGEEGLPSLSLDGLLDLIIDEADFNRRGAGEAGPRIWPTALEALERAAAGIGLAGLGPLKTMLLLPHPYDREKHETERARQIAFLADASVSRPCFVCAPLREVRQSPFGWGLVLKHMPSLRFWVPGGVSEALALRNGNMDFLAQPPEHALCLLQVRAGRKPSSFSVPALAIRRMDTGYMPCSSDAIESAACHLTEAGIAFMLPLRFDLALGRPLADYVLTEANPPRPVFLGGARAPSARASCEG